MGFVKKTVQGAVFYKRVGSDVEASPGRWKIKKKLALQVYPEFSLQEVANLMYLLWEEFIKDYQDFIEN